MSEGEGKKREAAPIGPHTQLEEQRYGVAAAYPYPAPSVQLPYTTGPPFYAQGYETYPGHAATVGQTTALKIERLPCWGLGFGWFLFIIGFFLAAIPWYVGAFIVLFVRVDDREKHGYIACSIAAIIAAIAAFFGLIQQAAGW